jgi:hypothetical protein
VIKKYPYKIKHIENPSEKVQLIAVNKDPDSIKDIQNPTERVQLAAVKHDLRLINFIKNPTEEAIQLARSIYKQKMLWKKQQIMLWKTMNSKTS